jgi:hypothetical protein
MDVIEIRARQIAAGKMGLVEDPHGLRLPKNLWEQCEAAARLEELHIEKARTLGTVLGMVDAVMLAEEHPDVFNMTQKLQELRDARKAYDVAAAAYLDARLAAK